MKHAQQAAVGTAKTVEHDPFAGGELARVAPTTEPQREVWLADRLGHDASLAFNESVRLRLRGKLDIAALGRGVQALVDRHDALRSVFGPDGETVCVRSSLSVALQQSSFSSLSPGDRETAVADRLRNAVETPFDLVNDALFRAELIRLGTDDHLLLLTAHHIVCDGWSWWVLVRELGALYSAQIGAEREPLDAAPDFADYAIAEAGNGANAQLRADEAYWLSRFADATPVLDLPLDRPRPARRTFSSRREDHVLDAELLSSIRRLGGRQGASLFATLLATFAGLLARLCDQQDVVVGIPAAGQSVDGHEQLVGHCVNLLPLRFAPRADLPFVQLVRQAQETLLDAIEHQRYTFGTLLKRLRVARDPARLPLVSVMFNIDQALDQQAHGFPGLELEFDSNPRSYENFELFVNAVETHGQLRLECQYNTDLFDQATVRRWLIAFESMLRAAVSQPEPTLGELPLVDPLGYAELSALQPLPVPFDHDCRMHEWFERQCDRTPDRVALVYGDVSLRYVDLEARANRIAHLLRVRGIRRGALVGLALDRGTDMLAALLGVLKAGATYVPLDPQFPPERLAYMAGDAGLAALLTHERHAAHFDLRGRPVLMLEQLHDELSALSDQRPGRDDGAAQPESAAYVIYTSGSTGRPKGVQVPHRAVANFIVGMQREPGISEADRLVAVTTLSFDIAMLELLLPLSVGAQVILAPREAAIDGMALKALLAGSQATFMQATPATWRLLLEAGWSGQVDFTVLCGGEPLPPDLAQQLLARCGALWNVYGPTETTVWSTCARIVPPPSGQPLDIHIGRPIANTSVWILDEHGRLCPRGVPGEICIGGAGVALGYLGRPELTAERFIVDTFAAGDLAGGVAPTLYRTGDRGRWRSDGCLEHLGRLDFQVKVRGYRIELGEIEATLASASGVKQAVVIAREDRPGDVRLVAYVVGQDRQVVDEPSLLVHLRGTLPDYMIPQHVMLLDAIPLLPNGKIDRKSLPAPGQSNAAGAAATAPRNALERSIATAMAQVLGVDDVDVHDDFFALGGHSLLAAQLTSRLNRELGLSLSLRTLFDAPSTARLAQSIAGDQALATARKPVLPRLDQRRAPLSLMQQRLWFLEQVQRGQVAWSTPSAHRLRGPLDVQAFDRAFKELVRRQASLRTVIVNEGEDAVQVVLDELEVPLLPAVDLTALPEADRDAEAMRQIDALVGEPILIDTAPLFRVRLFKLGDNEHILFFMPHHIIWDGWSFDIFYTEMSALYEAFSQGLSSPLSALPVSYGDFAEWHRDWLSGDELKAQVEHWKQHLAGEIEPLQLPLDKPRPPTATGGGDTVWLKVDRVLTDAMRELGNSANATLFMMVLTAYYALLHRLTGQREIVVGLPVRNRHTEALESVAGFFVNMLPLRLHIDPDSSFRQLLAQVREAMVAAFSSPDVPFEHLVRELKWPRDPSRAPIAQAMFSFQDIRERQTRWGALEHEYVPVFQPGSAHDIGLWLLEHAKGLSGGLLFNTDILERSTADRIQQRFVALLESVRRNPDAAIGALDLLTQADRQAFEQWNATACPAPAAATLHGMLQAQVRRTPQRNALRFGDAVWTYADLDRRAAQLAGALRARGAKSGDLIGVCLDRTPDLLATMIAVLKLGAGYVPLDPAYPAERLAFMAHDARLALTVSQGSLADALELPASQLLLLDADAGEIDAATAHPGSDDAQLAESVAYVIYTSGSTGKPKGVQVPHRAVVNFIDSMQREPGIGADDRLVAITTTSFDIAVLELFLPLTLGAEVILAPRECVSDGTALAALMSASDATIMQGTPASWRLLLESGWRGRAGFKALCGGEPLAPDLADALLARGVEVWNMYGPTETTVWSTCCRVTSTAGGITVGKPIANTSIWVLDDRGQLAPVGVPGEVCIGGAGVTLGYLDRPELTHERFIRDGFTSTVLRGNPACTLYRTGDLGRWRNDGTIEHLGRLDFQVKVRGYRIELGEIENQALAHPDVVRAAVLAREDRPGDVRLVAYVVAKSPGVLTPQALVAHLRTGLPDYMIPQHVVLLDALPLLPNGKVDRKALPKPVAGETNTPSAALPMASRASSADGDGLLQTILDVWSELFGVPVQPGDNFFELGGHSLLAVRLFHRLNQATGINLPLGALLDAPTVRALAGAYREAGVSQAVPEAGGNDPWAPLVSLRKGDSRLPSLFLIHAVGGNVLNYRRLAESMPPGPAIYGLQALGLDGRTSPLTSIEEMAERYLREIRSVQPNGPYCLGGGSMGGVIAFEMAQQLLAAGERVSMLALIDSPAPYPGEESQGRVTRLLRRLRHRLREMPLHHWPRAVLDSVRGRWESWQRHRQVGLAAKWGMEVPHSIRYANIEAVHRHAYQQYRFRPYPDAVTLFRAEEQDSERGDTLCWHHWAGEVEVIPISGSHQVMVEAEELPDRLAAVLARHAPGT